MDLEKFIRDFADQFEDVNTDELMADTEFKNLDEWTSLAALSIIAMIDDEYGVSVNGNDIRNSETIGDLFSLVYSKK